MKEEVGSVRILSSFEIKVNEAINWVALDSKTVGLVISCHDIDKFYHMGRYKYSSVTQEF